MSRLRFLHISMNTPQCIRNGIQSAIDCAYKEIDWVYIFGKYGKEGLELQIQHQVRTFKPDIIFMQIQREGVIDSIFARWLGKQAYVISWTGDVRNDISWYEAVAQHITMTLFSNGHDVKTLHRKKLRSDFLQVGFDEQIYYPSNNSSLASGQIVFCANHYTLHEFPLSGFRKKVAIALQQNFKENFRLYGMGWDHRVRSSGTCSGYDEAEEYRNCTIAINCSHFNYSRYSSDRLFRILACGGFCLSHRYEDIYTDFKEEKHLVTWQTPDELVDKCKFWLQPHNDTKRLKIARTGCELVHKHHRWKNRFLELNKITHKSQTMSIKKNDDWISQLPNVIPEKTYSQGGEESYIGYILNNIGVVNKYFVEFGAGNGQLLSNTCLLKEKYGWTGLMMDAEPQGNKAVQKEFITAGNIVGLLKKYNVPEEFDLLSIDLDGNDAYVLASLLDVFKPRLIVAEFNGTIPHGESRTIVYNPKHQWGNDDYYGFSFKAGVDLANIYGYKVIFQNAATNMYMVRKDCLIDPELAINIPFQHIPYHAHNKNGEWIDMKMLFKGS